MAAVCVFCASSESIEQSYLDLATSVGAGLAAAGHTLVFGGGQVSMMGALARAARAGGACTVGVIPEAMVSREHADVRAGELIVVPTMRERKRIMDERSDAVLALPGGIGTLEELFEMWTSAYLGMHTKPVIVLDSGGFFAPMWEFLDTLRAAGFISSHAFEALHPVDTIDAALTLLPR